VVVVRAASREIKIEVLAVGREDQRSVADFVKTVESGRVGLVGANDLAEIRPVQTVIQDAASPWTA